jgi:hypothetical protein
MLWQIAGSLLLVANSRIDVDFHTQWVLIRSLNKWQLYGWINNRTMHIVPVRKQQGDNILKTARGGRFKLFEQCATINVSV